MRIDTTSESRRELYKAKFGDRAQVPKEMDNSAGHSSAELVSAVQGSRSEPSKAALKTVNQSFGLDLDQI